MKWIDQQDDYFLHDYSAEKKEPAAGSTGDDSVSEPVASAPQPEAAPRATRSFSFTDETVSPSRPAAAIAANGPESPARKRSRRRRRWVMFLLIVLVVVITMLYIRYFVPYTSDTLVSGYVTLVEKRGIFFKTYEGEMITQQMLTDTAKVYQRDLYFSIPDDSLARVVQSYQGTGRPVTLTTQRYYGTVPWRGAQHTIVTAVEPQKVSAENE